MESNVKKVREALLAIKSVADREMRHHVSMSESDSTSIRAWSNLFVSLASQALSAPPRNCDVGTAEEQERRYDHYCHAHINQKNCCGDCPLSAAKAQCEFAWSQMPYEAEKGEGK